MSRDLVDFCLGAFVLMGVVGLTALLVWEVFR